MKMDIDENITTEEAIETLREAYNRAIKAQLKRDRRWRELTMLIANQADYPGEVADEVMLNYLSFDKLIGELSKG
jgi:hypothetical protein